MVPNRHSKHGKPARHRGRPLLAFLAVVALALGGWMLLGRGGGAPADPVANPTTSTGTTPRTDPLSAPADQASRDTVRIPAAPKLGGLMPAPTTTRATATPTMTTAAPQPPGATTTAPRPPRATTTAAPPPAPAPPGTPGFAEEVTRLSNAERAKAGCAPVRIDARLNAASQAHSKDMVDRDYFSHSSPDGKGPGDRASAAGYPSWSGENIAAGYPTPAAVVQGWMNSPGHKANILNCGSKATGVGFDARKNMWTQMFGSV
jgi:uncharacterized protein YkwD